MEYRKITARRRCTLRGRPKKGKIRNLKKRNHDIVLYTNAVQNLVNLKTLPIRI